ncbi:MAG: serine acetyltransferase [Clostridiales bacterium]|nr:serine acetyltransferase [Clostridiales bacterium]
MGKKTDKNIKDIVKKIIKNYDEHGLLSKIESDSRPNKEAIIEILDDLMCLIYPGFFGKQNLSRELIEYHVGEMLENVRHNLKKQLVHVFIHEGESECLSQIRQKADEICISFLSRLDYLRDMLACDVKAAYDGDPAAYSTDEIIYSYPGLLAITVNRIAHELYLLNVPIIPRIMTEYAHSVTGIDIHPGATIGKYFFMDHGTGIVIGETTVIGDNVKIYQGVTLGALSTRGGQTLRGVKRHPTLENDVTVYSGASILGGDTIIGRGVTIGSNAFVTKTVPSKTRVSIKNPELQYKNSSKAEFQQDEFWFWTI